MRSGRSAMYGRGRLRPSGRGTNCQAVGRAVRATGLLALMVIALGLVSGCRLHPQNVGRFEYTRMLMGVRADLVVFAANEAEGERLARVGFAEVARLEAMMSDWRAGSELSQLGVAAVGSPVCVSPELVEVLAGAQRVARASGGRFDVTVGPLTALWREARRTGVMASEATLAEARARSGWALLTVDERAGTVGLAREGMRLDVGGIAKGYAAERAVRAMEGAGATAAMAALAGDVFAGAARPAVVGRAGGAWEVVAEAGAGGSGEAGRTLRVVNRAVSTSGDAFQTVEINGRRMAHLIDARTGTGADRVYPVTVVAKRGWVADALASALCLMGPGPEADALVRGFADEGVEVVFHPAAR